jgi:hypothetical protein
MPAYLFHTAAPLVGLARSQTLSPARLVFLIALVVFFTALFIVAYVWMRKPEFGQHSHHVQPTGLRTPEVAKGRSSLHTDAGGEDLVAPRVHAVDRPRESRVAPTFDGSDQALRATGHCTGAPRHAS